MWIIFPILLFSITAGCNKEHKNKAWLAFALFAVLYSLRGEYGADWDGYEYYFNHINDAAIAAKSGFELGYRLLCWGFHLLGLPFRAMVAVISLFVCAVFYKAISRYTDNAGIAMLVGLFYYFYPSLEALRQIIAIALFLYSLQYIHQDQIKYFLFNLIGLMFHRTAIIPLFFFFFMRYHWAKIACVAATVALPVLHPVLVQVLEIVPVVREKYLWYFQNSASVSIFSVLSFKLLEYVFLAAVFMLLPNKSKMEKLVAPLLQMGVWITGLLPLVMSGAYRFAYYSDLGIVLAYCCLYDRVKERKYRCAYIAVIIAYVAFRFYRIISANPQLFTW